MQEKEDGPGTGGQRKRQRTAKGAAWDEKSEKRPKEEKKQELRRNQEEGHGDESFKTWLSGLHRRRQVSGSRVGKTAGVAYPDEKPPHYC